MPSYSPEIGKALAMMHYLRELYGKEVILGVSTRDKYVFYERGSVLDLGIRAEDQVPEGSISYLAIKAGHRVTQNVPGNLFGVPFIGIAVPFFDNMQVVGSIAVGLPIDAEENLQQIASKMNSSVEAVSQGASGFAASTEELAATSLELANNTSHIRDDVKDMDSMISFIMEIASQTHLLGLNAAIEAARAGDSGRGFTVVAEEIRKLAGSSQSSTKEVTERLNKIRSNIYALSEHVLQVSAVAQEQAATSEEIMSSIQQLEPISKELMILSDSLVK